jgi:hypothetical protein
MRPQRFPAGLGARNITPSSNSSSRVAQNRDLATDSNQSRPAIYRRVQESSSSLPADTSSVPRRGSSDHSPPPEHRLNHVQEKASLDGPSGSHGVDPGSTNGFKSAYTDGTSKMNMVKTPLSATKHHSDSSHPTTSPQEVGDIRILDSRASPNFVSLFPAFPPCLPPLPINSRPTAPVNSTLIDVHTFPIQFTPFPPPPPTPGIPYVTMLKGGPAILGMPHDGAKAGGTRGLFLKELEPPPNPCHSVVMEILPRKFRSQSFVLEWLSQFHFQPNRYELVEGKILFEFKTEEDARFAWHSPRMGGPDGLLCVRLFWYRLPPQPALENMNTVQKVNTKGAIEDSAQPQPQPRPQPISDSTTEDSGFEDREADLSRSQVPAHKSDAPPPTSTINASDPAIPVNPPAKDIKTNPDNQTSRGTSSSKHPVRNPTPTPATTTCPLVNPPQPSDRFDNQMDADTAMTGELPPGGVSSFFPDTAISQTFVPPTIPPSTLPPSAACTSTAVFPAFPQDMFDSSIVTTSVDPHAPPFAMPQDLMKASHSTAEMFHFGNEVERTEFEKVDGLPPQTVMEAGALAKEQTLRELVLQSRKRKLLQAGGSQPSSSTTAPTATSGNALEQLAANFIADAISRPPAAKRVKITPSPAAMNAWGIRLEKHIVWSKAIMKKIQSARTRTEKSRLLEILREKDRCVSR